MKYRPILLTMLITLFLCSCGQEKKKYVIGVSQCSEDSWREKLHDEMDMSTYFYEGVELRYACANDDYKHQMAQIDSLVATGIDLLIASPQQLSTISPAIDRAYDKGITKVVGIESRGFMMAGVVASELKAGAVMCRKPGKLPAETIKQSYKKEYGEDTIEIHKGSIGENDVVLIHDDLLATGGSMRAAYDLVKKFNPKKIYVNFIIELTIEGLHGRDAFEPDTDISTLLIV